MRRMVSSLVAVIGLAIGAVAPGQSRAANLMPLVSFSGADGATPLAALIYDANGSLFGTTEFGGANNAGTVFEITKTASGYASTPTTLVSFCSLASCADGASPIAGLLADARGNLFGTALNGGASDNGTVFEIFKTARGYASTPTILVNFSGVDGRLPAGGLIADARGNLFGTTLNGGASDNGTVFEIAKTARGYASTPTTLVSFSGVDGESPPAGLIADAKRNLFGTTFSGGANNAGTVFEITKTARGYASTPTTLVSFCSLASCADGASPNAGLIADARGNLFGTTLSGGANNAGTVFEVANSGFVIFAGTPGKPNCIGQSVSALALRYGGLNAAAEALGYPSVQALQRGIMNFCEG